MNKYKVVEQGFAVVNTEPTPLKLPPEAVFSTRDEAEAWCELRNLKAQVEDQAKEIRLFKEIAALTTQVIPGPVRPPIPPDDRPVG